MQRSHSGKNPSGKENQYSQSKSSNHKKKSGNKNPVFPSSIKSQMELENQNDYFDNDNTSYMTDNKLQYVSNNTLQNNSNNNNTYYAQEQYYSQNNLNYPQNTNGNYQQQQYIQQQQKNTVGKTLPSQFSAESVSSSFQLYAQSYQKTRNQIKGIMPSKKQVGKGAIRENKILGNNNFNPGIHRTYKKYQELEYTVELTRRFEFYEKLQHSNRQLPTRVMTAQCYWFIICCQYFPRNMIYQNLDVYDYVNHRIQSHQLQVKQRISQQFINGYKIRAKNQLQQLQQQQQQLDSQQIIQEPTPSENNLDQQQQQQNQNNSLLKSDNNNILLNECSNISTLSTKSQSVPAMERKLKDVFNHYDPDFIENNIENNKNVLLKQNYTLEDDLYIIQTRQYMLNFYEKNCLRQTQKNSQNYYKCVDTLKTMDIDYIINMYSVDLQQQIQQNQIMIETLSQNIETVIYTERQFPNEEDLDFSDPLVDLQSLSEKEKQYLEIMEQIMQQGDLDYNNNNNAPSNKTNNIEQQGGKRTESTKSTKRPVHYNLDQLQDDEDESDQMESTHLQHQQQQKQEQSSNSENNHNNQAEQSEVKDKKDNNKDKNSNYVPSSNNIESEDYICQICNDGCSEDEDLIVFCSKCNISVHQRCYGINKVPDEDWVCDVCQSFGPQGQYLKCPLCAQRGGAMKPSRLNIDNHLFIENNPTYYQFYNNTPMPKDFKQKKQKYLPRSSANGKFISKSSQNGKKDEDQDLYYDFHKVRYKQYTPEQLKNEPVPYQIWVHISCIIWTPEAYFEDRNSYNLVKGLDNIDRKRFNLVCGVCGLKKTGSCVQCPRSKCTEAFHPECARRYNKYMEHKDSEKHQFLIYCDHHIPLKLKRQLEQKERKYKEDLIKFAKCMEKYYEAYVNESQKDLKGSLKIHPKGHGKSAKESNIEDKMFLKALCDYVTYTPNKFFTLTVQKSTIGKYKLLNVQKPKPFNPHNFISKYDEMWYNLEFNGLKPEQLYKKYRKILQYKRAELTKAFEEFNKNKKREELAKKKRQQQLKQQQLKQRQLDQKLKREREKEMKKKRKEDEKKLKLQKLQQKLSKQKEKYLQKKQKKKQQMKQMDYYQAPIEELYCLCQKPYVEGEVMIQCERCEEWYHFECIRYKGTQQQAETLNYICEICDQKDAPEIRAQRKLQYRHLFIYEEDEIMQSSEDESEEEEQQEEEEIHVELNDLEEEDIDEDDDIDENGYNQLDDDDDDAVDIDNTMLSSFSSEEMEQTKPSLKQNPYKIAKLDSTTNNNIRDEDMENEVDLLDSEINDDISDLADEDLEPTTHNNNTVTNLQQIQSGHEEFLKQLDDLSSSVDNNNNMPLINKLINNNTIHENKNGIQNINNQAQNKDSSDLSSEYSFDCQDLTVNSKKYSTKNNSQQVQQFQQPEQQQQQEEEEQQQQLKEQELEQMEIEDSNNNKSKQLTNNDDEIIQQQQLQQQNGTLDQEKQEQKPKINSQQDIQIDIEQQQQLQQEEKEKEENINQINNDTTSNNLQEQQQQKTIQEELNNPNNNNINNSKKLTNNTNINQPKNIIQPKELKQKLQEAQKKQLEKQQSSQSKKNSRQSSKQNSQYTSPNKNQQPQQQQPKILNFFQKLEKCQSSENNNNNHENGTKNNLEQQQQNNNNNITQQQQQNNSEQQKQQQQTIDQQQ